MKNEYWVTKLKNERCFEIFREMCGASKRYFAYFNGEPKISCGDLKQLRSFIRNLEADELEYYTVGLGYKSIKEGGVKNDII